MNSMQSTRYLTEDDTTDRELWTVRYSGSQAKVVSFTSDTKIEKFVINNMTGSPAALFWIDWVGKVIFYGTIRVGSSLT